MNKVIYILYVMADCINFRYVKHPALCMFNGCHSASYNIGKSECN